MSNNLWNHLEKDKELSIYSSQGIRKLKQAVLSVSTFRPKNRKGFAIWIVTFEKRMGEKS